MSTLRDTLAPGAAVKRRPPLAFPLWKHLLVVAVLVMGLIYAMPNLYPDDPAVQVTGSQAAIEVNESLFIAIKNALAARNVVARDIQLLDKSVLVRFENTEQQLKAKDILQQSLGEDFLVALNLAPTTPGWLQALGAYPLKLGLDLRGGVHFLMEVDMAAAVQKRMEAYQEELRGALREERIRYRRLASDPAGTISLTLASVERVDDVEELFRTQFRDFTPERVDADTDQPSWLLTLSEIQRKSIEDYAISQNLTTLRNRVDELGVAEATVQRQGRNRIVVQLPGVQDTASAKRVLGRTASLEFRLQDYSNQSSAIGGGSLPPGSELFPFKNNERPDVLLYKKVIVTGDQVINARANYDENGQPQVNITLSGDGGRKMHRVTRDHVGEPMAVLFLETRSRWVEVNGEQVRQAVYDKYVINVATIQSALGQSFRITGLDSPEESSELALLLRAGALAAPIYFVEERTIGPSLGQENINAGFQSIVLGFCLVLGFMVFYYRVFGFVANLALLMNLVVLIALMSLIPGATLTLPGMAGIVLTVGMAVDANVLIFSRIKEEYGEGASPVASIAAGYDRAFSTIWDANLTTLIVAVILFAFGNGPVKGFAVTLSLGILTSMFTAIVGTRSIISLLYGGRKLERLKI
jgi:preprotein translocase subunit SecD